MPEGRTSSPQDKGLVTKKDPEGSFQRAIAFPLSPHGAIRPRNYNLLPSKAIMPRFRKSANGFSKISFAHAQAASHKENAGAVLIIRACHEAIRACRGSVSGRLGNSPMHKKRASARRPMENGSRCDFRENRARETTFSVAARSHPSPKLQSSPFQGDHAAFP